MPFNGSGTFNRIYSWVTDAANGIDVSSSRTDTDTNDIAACLTNCITKDGQQTVTAKDFRGRDSIAAAPVAATAYFGRGGR